MAIAVHTDKLEQHEIRETCLPLTEDGGVQPRQTVQDVVDAGMRGSVSTSLNILLTPVACCARLEPAKVVSEQLSY